MARLLLRVSVRAWTELLRTRALHSSSSDVTSPRVIHDRPNERFTLDCGGGGAAVLRYRRGRGRDLELLSTEVPACHRGRGVASLLTQAALDFIVEEDLRIVKVSCWYIHTFLKENTHLRHQRYTLHTPQ